MCRNIRILYNFEPPTTEDEIGAAAIQYVRKVSGMQKPSRANEAAFEQAVEEISATTARLLEKLVTAAPPRDREAEEARRRARAAERFGERTRPKTPQSVCCAPSPASPGGAPAAPAPPPGEGGRRCFDHGTSLCSSSCLGERSGIHRRTSRLLSQQQILVICLTGIGR
jgi:hypothetical protein